MTSTYSSAAASHVPALPPRSSLLAGLRPELQQLLTYEEALCLRRGQLLARATELGLRWDGPLSPALAKEARVTSTQIEVARLIVSVELLEAALERRDRRQRSVA